MLKPMLPTLSLERPTGNDWVYEVKYDGFRCLLFWSTEEILLISRNGRSLNKQFPEIVDFCKEIQPKLESMLPVLLDGELVSLSNRLKGDFAEIQTRGRLRRKETIDHAAKQKPCSLLVFDLLQLQGKTIASQPLSKRKQKLEVLFTNANLSTNIEPNMEQRLGFIRSQQTIDSLWKEVQSHDGEGVIAKKTESVWEEGKRTKAWLKLKNYKIVTCFVTAYQKDNGYFHVSVFQDTRIKHIGLFKHGLSLEQHDALLQTIRKNQSKETKEFIEIQPALCLDIQCLELYQDQLREPSFFRFRFDITPNECTWELMSASLQPKTTEVEITSPDKVLWNEIGWTKKQYIDYLKIVHPRLLPFLQNRALTVIRYPHGVSGEAFYQKNCPEYAPPFIETKQVDGIDYIICNSIETLLWLGNQAAIELHIPFQTVSSPYPSEIVFDFDPPSRKEFQLAVEAALITKEVLDGLSLTSFVKTSGNKGLQMYIPLPENRFSFDDTRVFTSFIANFLTSNYPSKFTTERLKKNRGNRLYVDYIQHAEGKTIIAPYSVRGNKDALVATPLFWEEVTLELRPEQFPISVVQQRITKKGCPFESYFTVKHSQPLNPILEFLGSRKSE